MKRMPGVTYGEFGVAFQEWIEIKKKKHLSFLSNKSEAANVDRSCKKIKYLLKSFGEMYSF